MIGLSSGKVLVQPYTSAWEQLFREEQAKLRAAIGHYVLDIQHIGSTSVPNLAAKPIIDIGVAVANFEEAVQCIAPLEQLGYVYRDESGPLRRHYFVKGSNDARTHHLHMNEIQSEEWQQQIAFRDYLRQHAEAVQAYAELKLRLAEQFPDDRQAYAGAKAGFISHLLHNIRPDEWPQSGERVIVRAFKSDRKPYRWWSATIEEIKDNLIVTVSPPGNLVHDKLKGDWTTPMAMRAYYWIDRPYNLLEVYRSDGNLDEIYIHITSPVIVKSGELLFADYELAVVQRTGEEAFIDDEDEFAEAIVRYGYSLTFQELCYRTAHETLELARTWTAKGCPFYQA